MSFDLAEARLILVRTPSVLSILLQDLPTGWTDVHEGPKTWSPFDVVGHLIHGEKTDWIPRVKIILARGDDVMFEPFDRFAHLREPETKTLDELLQRFSDLRNESLQTLQDLAITPDQYAWTGLHPEFGDVTLAQLLATWVAHDLGHIAQVTRVMAKRYRDEVGPWQKYLRIITS